MFGNFKSRVKILDVLPQAMKKGTGKYVERPDIHEIHTSWLNQNNLPHYTPMEKSNRKGSSNVNTKYTQKYYQ